MNKFRTKMENRGSALISVLIAISFIATLSATMLYMTYNNFSMKTVNSKSSANFYGAEEGLTKASQAIRNTTYNQAKPNNVLRTVLAVNADNRYNIENVAKMAFPDDTVVYNPATKIATVQRHDAEGKIETYEFSSTIPDSDKNYVYDDSTYGSDKRICVTLKGVKVTKVSSSEYVNSIVTDIVYKYEDVTTSSAGKTGLGDFSIIADSGALVGAGDARTGMNVFGNAYFGCPSDSMTAIKLTNGVDVNEALVNFTGDYAIVYGDIILDGNSVMNIVSTEITVCGNIYLKGNSTLLCTGTLRFPDCIDTRTGSANYGNKFGIINSGGKTYPNDLATITQTITAENYANITDLLNYDTPGPTTGLCAQIIVPQVPINDSTVSPIECSDILGCSDDLDKAQVINGDTYYARFTKKDDNNLSRIKNRIIFFCAPNMKLPDGNGTGTFHATLLAKYSLKMEGDRSYDMTQLGMDVYNQICEVEVEDLDGNKKNSSGEVYKYTVGGFISPGTTSLLNDLTAYATDGSTSVTSTKSLSYYENWSKQ